MNLTFDQIVLNISEREFLEKLLAADTWLHESAAPDDSNIHLLLKLGFIEEITSEHGDFYLISDLGERFLLYLNRYNTRHFWSEFRAWVTLAIAVAAFILSVISLYLQYR